MVRSTIVNHKLVSDTNAIPRDSAGDELERLLQDSQYLKRMMKGPMKERSATFAGDTPCLVSPDHFGVCIHCGQCKKYSVFSNHFNLNSAKDRCSALREFAQAYVRAIVLNEPTPAWPTDLPTDANGRVIKTCATPPDRQHDSVLPTTFIDENLSFPYEIERGDFKHGRPRILTEPNQKVPHKVYIGKPVTCFVCHKQGLDPYSLGQHCRTKCCQQYRRFIMERLLLKQQALILRSHCRTTTCLGPARLSDTREARVRTRKQAIPIDSFPTSITTPPKGYFDLFKAAAHIGPSIRVTKLHDIECFLKRFGALSEPSDLNKVAKGTISADAIQTEHDADVSSSSAYSGVANAMYTQSHHASTNDITVDQNHQLMNAKAELDNPNLFRYKLIVGNSRPEPDKVGNVQHCVDLATHAQSKRKAFTSPGRFKKKSKKARVSTPDAVVVASTNQFEGSTAARGTIARPADARREAGSMHTTIPARKTASRTKTRTCFPAATEYETQRHGTPRTRTSIERTCEKEIDSTNAKENGNRRTEAVSGQSFVLNNNQVEPKALPVVPDQVVVSQEQGSNREFAVIEGTEGADESKREERVKADDDAVVAASAQVFQSAAWQRPWRCTAMIIRVLMKVIVVAWAAFTLWFFLVFLRIHCTDSSRE